MRDLGFAAIVVMMLPMAVMSTFVGVLLWVWVAMLSPSDALTGFMTGVPLNKIVFGVVVLSMLAPRQKKSLYLDPAGIALLLFCVSATISSQTSISSPDLTWEIFQKLMKESALALCIMWVMTTRLRIQALVFTVVVALSFIGAKEGLIGVLTAGGHKITGIGSVGDNNALATALLMMLPFALYVSRHLELRPARLAVLAVAGLSLVTILLTKSRGGFGGLVILAVLLILRSDKKAIGLIGVAAVGGAILLLAPSEIFSRLDTVSNLEADGSAVGRFVAWKISLLIALANPLFGGGGHAVQFVPVWNHFVPLIGSVNFISTPMVPTYALAAHSIYFEILGDNGFVGFGLYLSVIGATLLNCLSIRRMARPYPELRWARELAQATAMSIILYLTTGALLSMGYFELFYITVGMVSACRMVVKREVAAIMAAAPSPAGLAPVARPAVPAWQPDPLSRPLRPTREIVRRV